MERVNQALTQENVCLKEHLERKEEDRKAVSKEFVQLRKELEQVKLENKGK